MRRFKPSTDPAFAAKVEDVVGLYIAPPKHAIVLSLDESRRSRRSTAPSRGLPMKPGRLGTMTHDYKRHGTTTLFAALDVLEGTVIGQCLQRHRNQEFIRFLNGIERQVPAGKVIHVSSTTMPPPSTQMCASGWRAIPAGSSTSRRPRAPG